MVHKVLVVNDHVDVQEKDGLTECQEEEMRPRKFGINIEIVLDRDKWKDIIVAV